MHGACNVVRAAKLGRWAGLGTQASSPSPSICDSAATLSYPQHHRSTSHTWRSLALQPYLCIIKPPLRTTHNSGNARQHPHQPGQCRLEYKAPLYPPNSDDFHGMYLIISLHDTAFPTHTYMLKFTSLLQIHRINRRCHKPHRKQRC